MRRGEIRAHHRFTERRFVVVSNDALNSTGLVIVVEITRADPGGIQGLVVVPLTEADPVAGWIRAYRINYVRDVSLAEPIGALCAATLDNLAVALRATQDL